MIVKEIVLFCLLCQFVHGLDNGLALTPPMGWISWERFRCNVDCVKFPDDCISERLYMKVADLMVSGGYKDAGYEYVNIDDCWMAKQRDKNNKLVADPDRFPSGIKALAQYVHSKGLKLGIYEDFGTETCGDYPGSEFYMEIDANTFAEWDVDMLKFDGCNSDPKDMPKGYPQMETYLNKTGRPIVYSCEWPLYEYANHIQPDYEAIAKTCNLWRNYNDVDNNWGSIISIIDFYGANQDNFSYYASPGSWNDPDMLVIGDLALSQAQQKVQMGMWALLAAPLMMSNDLRNIDVGAKNLLLNKNIIAINQDPLGNQAIRIYEAPNSISVWVKKLSNPGSLAIGVLNKGSEVTTYSTTFGDLGLKNKNGYTVREAFENQNMGSYSLSLPLVIQLDSTSIFIIIVDPL